MRTRGIPLSRSCGDTAASLPFALLLAGLLASNVTSPLFGTNSLHLGAVQLFPVDVALAAGLAIAGYRRSLRVPPCLAPLLGLLALNTVWGLHAFSSQVALNGARSWWWLAGAVVVAASSQVPLRVLVLGLVGVEALALASLARYGIQGATAGRVVDGEFFTLRPLTEAGALLLLQLLVLLLPAWWRSSAGKWLLLLCACVLIVVVQQRTTWLAALAVGPVVVARWLRDTGRQRNELRFASLGVICLVAPVLTWFVTHSHTIAGSASDSGTWRWRVASWRGTLDQMSAQAWVVGHPAGAAPSRYIAGVLENVQPHNLFVEASFRFGVLGLAALLAIGAGVIRRGSMDWLVMYGILASSAVAALTYGPSPVVGASLGLILGATRQPAVDAAPMRSSLFALGGPARS